MNDLSVLSKDSDTACHGKMAVEKQAYMSLPRPGVNDSDGELNINNNSARNSLVLRDFEGKMVPEFENPQRNGFSEGIVVKRQKIHNGGNDETTQKMEYRISVMIEELAAAMPPPTVGSDFGTPRPPSMMPGEQMASSPASTPGDESSSSRTSTTFRQHSTFSQSSSSSVMMKSVQEWEEELDAELGKMIQGMRVSTTGEIETGRKK